MNKFIPRYDEIRFALKSWANLPHLMDLQNSNEGLVDIVNAVIDEAGRFASQVLAPIDHIGDRDGCSTKNNQVRLPRGWIEAYRKFIDAQWNTVHFSRALGGQGLPVPVSIAVSEMFNAASRSCHSPES